MGISKKHFYKEEQLIFSNLFKALGHPARISIVELLSNNDSLNCADLMTNIELSQSTISHHCQVLHECGLVGYEVIKNNCYYRLDNHIFDQLSEYVGTINIETSSISGKVYYPVKQA